MKIGFDHEKYTALQSEQIIRRIDRFDGKVPEFGGKIFDHHAARTLPGFHPDSKISML